MVCFACSNIHFIKETVGTCAGAVVDLGFNASAAGEHVLKLQFLGSEISIKKTFEVGEAVTFPTHGLNEKFQFMAKVFDPEGAEITFTIDSVQYNCIAFETTFKIQL